jgi:hypothetical protein
MARRQSRLPPAFFKHATSRHVLKKVSYSMSYEKKRIEMITTALAHLTTEPPQEVDALSVRR